MKRIAIILIFILIISTLFSCRSKKSIIETHSTDTIYRSEIIKITPSRLNSLVIDNPCDSLGKLKPFNYTLKQGNDKIIAKVIDNKILFEVNYDSIKESALKEYKSTQKNYKEVEIQEVKRPLNLYSIFLNVILAIWIFKKPLLRLINPL